MTHVLVDLAHWLSEGVGWLPLLVDAMLKATAMLAGAWLLSVVLRRTSAATRHFVWTIALAGSLAMPVLLVVMPRWSVPVLPAAFTAPTGPSAAEGSVAERFRRSGDGALQPESRNPQPPAVTLGQALSLVMPKAATLLVLWGSVALLLVGRLVVGHLRVRRLARVSSGRPPWLPLAHTLCAQVGLARPPSFVEGTADAMPMTWGLWRHVVMVPSAAVEWPESRLRVVLLHELAHVVRRDCLTQTIAGLVCALYWFNPLSWIGAARLRAERERACDDSVLAAGTDGGDYAEQLLDIARAMRPAGLLSWATVSMARRSQLEGRLLAILDPNLPRRAPTRTAAAIAVFTLAALVPTLAAIEAGPRAETAGRPAEQPLQTAVGNVQTSTARAQGDVALDMAGVSQRPAPTPMPMPTPTPTPTPNPNPRWGGGMAAAIADGVRGAGGWGGEGDKVPQKPVDQKVIDALTAALKDSDADVRQQALSTLAKLGDRRVTPTLVQALGDTSVDVREQAAIALGQSRDPAAVEPLIAALKDQTASVREQAAFALGQVRDLRAVDPVIALVADVNADVREQAVFALSQMRDRRATPVLSAALKDASAGVREQAAFALSQLRDPAATEALVTLLKDPKPDVRAQAVFALGQIRDARAVDPLILALKDSSPDVQEKAAFALGQMRDRKAVTALIGAITSSSADVRQQAAFALGQIGDASATDALMTALKDADADVRQAAAFALSRVIGREDKNR